MQPLHAALAQQVWDLLAEHVRPGNITEVATEEALGTVLARDARSSLDYPPFDRALMDGYAVRSASVAGPARLRNLGLVPAGARAAPEIGPDTCARINTGAPLPPGADAIVPVEDAVEEGDAVRFEQPARVGDSVERRAAILSSGGLVIRAGTRIGPGAIAALISAGIFRVSVFQRASVAILGTGDEIVPAGEALDVGQIYDSNSVMLAELVRRSHASLAERERCPDDPDALAAALSRGLRSDLLCVTGGMSKGTHDLVPGALEKLGVRWVVTSLNLKPGKPMRLGRSPAGGWVIGLPGNPVSCSVCFLLFGRPLLDALQGTAFAPPRRMRATLQRDLPANGARPMYQPAEWTVAHDGGPLVTPQTWRGSGDPFGMASANGLIERAARAPAVSSGDTVLVIPFDGPQ